MFSAGAGGEKPGVCSALLNTAFLFTSWAHGFTVGPWMLIQYYTDQQQ